MHTNKDENQTEHRNKFSVNIILTDPCESNDEPLQFNPPVINSLLPNRNRRSTSDVTENFYKEKLSALAKIKELQRVAANLSNKIEIQEKSIIMPSDNELLNRTSQKIGYIKARKDRKLCNCNQSCRLF